MENVIARLQEFGTTYGLKIVASVGYCDDLDKVRIVLEDILSGDDRILKDPAPTIGVLELADSSVNFAVRPVSKLRITGMYSSPQQDVHLYKSE